MKLQDIFMMMGGLALFLYGMQVMCRGLEVAAGDKLRTILEKLTSRRWLGVLVGAGITAVIQSSSATTVMVVGFVNSGLMTLAQAVGVIMGANIGTTITGQLIVLKVGLIAPLLAFFGVAITMFSKKQKTNSLGEILAGLGILFIGMDLMSSSMAPLRSYEPFVQLLSRFSNPLLGILAGAAFTALVQSSSASIGILQALAFSGVIGLDSAVYVLFGQNIGTCITALIASMGANRAAKRTTLIHFLFNAIGTVLFTCICLFTPFTDWMALLAPESVAAQIANTHTIFNIVTTLLLLPFGTQLANLACRILPDSRTDLPQIEFADPTATFVDEHGIGTTAILAKQLQAALVKMFAMAQANVQLAFQALLQRDPALLEQVSAREDEIDRYNAQIVKAIGQASTHEMSTEAAEHMNRMLVMSANIERIGDHAMNMAEYLQPMDRHHVVIDPTTENELTALSELAAKALGAIVLSGENAADSPLQLVSRLEGESDTLSKQYRKEQIRRLQTGESDAELSILYSEMLTDFERMLDHTLNIAEAVYA